MSRPYGFHGLPYNVKQSIRQAEFDSAATHQSASSWKGRAEKGEAQLATEQTRAASLQGDLNNTRVELLAETARADQAEDRANEAVNARNIADENAERLFGDLTAADKHRRAAEARADAAQAEASRLRAELSLASSMSMGNVNAAEAALGRLHAVSEAAAIALGAITALLEYEHVAAEGTPHKVTENGPLRADFRAARSAHQALTAALEERT